MLRVVWSGAHAVGWRGVLWIGDVVRLGHAARRDSGSIGATAARFPGRFAAFTGIGNLLGGCQESLVLAEGAILELVARVGMSIDLFRRALTAPAGPDLLSFPVTLREGRIAVLIVVGGVFKKIFVGFGGEAVDDGLDSWNPTSNHHSLMCLLVGIHPPRELDDAVFY